MRALWVCLMLSGFALGQTDYDKPYQYATTNFGDVLSLLEASTGTLFLIVPDVGQELFDVLTQKTSEGVIVYLLVPQTFNANTARALIEAGVSIRTRESGEQAIAMIDYATLVAGELLLGAGSAEIVNTSSYDLVMVNQLGNAWQSANPF